VSEADELRAENARLWEEVHRLRAERQEVDYFRRLALQMEGSVSWKITTPLREAKRVGMIVRRKLDEG
jgi:hypothetical protein